MKAPDPIQFPFHVMAAAGNLRGLRSMLEQAEAEHSKLIVNHADSKGWTPLHIAASKGHAAIVQLLVQCGADPTLPVGDEEGFPPLYLATLAKKTDVVACLLLVGADPNQRSKVGYAALHEAARLGTEDIASALIEDGATCDIKGPDGSTPLCWAVLQEHVRIAELLLQAGVDPNTPGIGSTFFPGSNFRVTPLYAAATSGNGRLVDILLRYGADPNHRNARGPGGHTCLHEAARAGNLAMAKQLVAAGMDADVKAFDGTTAADWAARKGHSKVTIFLRGVGKSPQE